MEHWDSLAVWRLIELKRALWQMDEGDTRLVPWEARLRDLESFFDPMDRLLSEVESQFNGGPAHRVYDPSQLELFERGQGVHTDVAMHQIRLLDGHVFRGTWHDIVRQMRDNTGFSHETPAHYMRRLAERWHEERGVDIPFQKPESFIRATIRERLISLEEE